MEKPRMARSVNVTDDEGAHIRERRERLAMSQSELERLTDELGHKISRKTIAAVEAGDGFRRPTITRLRAALDRAEEEFGLHVPSMPTPGDEVRVELTMADGTKIAVTTKGSELAGKVAAEVEALLKQRGH